MPASGAGADGTTSQVSVVVSYSAPSLRSRVPSRPPQMNNRRPSLTDAAAKRPESGEALIVFHPPDVAVDPGWVVTCFGCGLVSRVTATVATTASATAAVLTIITPRRTRGR